MKETEGLDDLHFYGDYHAKKNAKLTVKQTKTQTLLAKGRKKSRILSFINFGILLILMFVFVPRLFQNSSQITTDTGYRLTIEAQALSSTIVLLLTVENLTATDDSDQNQASIEFFADNSTFAFGSEALIFPTSSQQVIKINKVLDKELLAGSKKITAIITFLDGSTQELVIMKPR